jgi:hypothetical protein
MTDHTIIELAANGNALQAYLGVRFVEDSGTPDLDAGDRCLVQPTPGGGLLIQPLRALDYPVVVDGPPDGLDQTDIPTDVAAGIAEIDDGDLQDVATDAEGNQHLTNGRSAGGEPAEAEPAPTSANADPGGDD